MKRFLKNMVANWKKAKKAGSAAKASRRRSFRPGLESLEDRTVPTILFDPVVSGAEVLQNSGAPMSPSQLASNNSYALKNPTVYFMFVGPAWGTDDNPIAAVGNMTSAAQAIFSSSYLSGLKQYGSDGHATYGGRFVDPSLNPDGWRASQSLGHPYYLYSKGQNPDGTYQLDNSPNTAFYETGRVLLAQKPSWAPSTSDGTRGPIYVVVRYDSSENGGEGSNAFGLQPGGVDYVNPNNDPDYRYLPQGMNFIDIVLAPPSASDPMSDVDSFSWAFSHELVERISTGTGDQIRTGIDIVSRAGFRGQIADGEPENSNSGFAWRLNGSNGSTPKVTSYWSVLDQAFIVPDGSQSNVLLEPLWGHSQWNMWLNQGKLYELNLDNGYQLPTGTTTPIDSNVQSFVTDDSGHVFCLTGNGQVWEYDANTPKYFPVTGSSTTAKTLAWFPGDDYGFSAGPVILGHNIGQDDTVSLYTGSPYHWMNLTPPLSAVSALAWDGNGIYVVGDNAGYKEVWKYGPGVYWAAITGTNTTVANIVTSTGPQYTVYMMATNNGNGSPYQVYRLNGLYATWGLPLNDPTGSSALNVTQISSAYAGLDVLSGGRVMEFHNVDSSWSYLTGGTSVAQIASSGGTLYMVGTNGGANQAWQYTGTPYAWTQLTQANSTVYQIAVDASNLYMVADNGGGKQIWQYSGTPNWWTAMSDPAHLNLETGFSSWIAIGPDGTLWVRGYYNGVLSFYTYVSTTVGGHVSATGSSSTWTDYAYSAWNVNNTGYSVPALFW
jgi:hypothetical protein